MTLRVLSCGPTATLLEVGSTEEASVLAGHLRRATVSGLIEIVPAARTVLVECADEAVVAAVSRLVPGLDLRNDPGDDGVLVEVPTVYDGPDLASVAARTGLSVAEVTQLHSGGEYRAAFCGFAPGFAYLTGLPAVLQLPRRSDPRAKVPPGSVAIAAEFTGVYPTASPGGWHLLGRTDTAMWDPERARPAHIAPGDQVRFVPVDR